MSHTTFISNPIFIFIPLVVTASVLGSRQHIFTILKQTAGVRSAIGQQQHHQSCIPQPRNNPFPFPSPVIAVIIVLNLASARLATMSNVDSVVRQINKACWWPSETGVALGGT